jgi:heterodisulfide reductase subunit B
MKLSYYPGCTLKTEARELEKSAIASMRALGIEPEEPERWNCCGTVYSFAEDDLIHHLASVRNLVRIKEQGNNKVLTLCSFCYNTLKRVNLLMKNDPEKLKTINDFMDEEIDYNGEVEVVHFLEVLRDDIGWEEIARQVKTPLKDLKVAPYYGCTLHRPAEAAIEQPNRPTAMPDLLQAIGATSIDFPYRTTCCGSYQVVANPEVVINRTREILNSASESGAEIIAVSCPLCEHNLREEQKELGEPKVPIIYFTQLLAIALGVEPHLHEREENPADPRPLLESKGLLAAGAAT